MIQSVPPKRLASFGPVMLAYSDRSAWVTPGQPLARIIREDFQTNLEALERVRALWGKPDFLSPVIYADGEGVWHLNEMEQYVRDVVVFAAELAGVLQGDLARGPVTLHSNGRIIGTPPTLRDCLIAIADDVTATTSFITDAATGTPLVLPDPLKAAVNYIRLGRRARRQEHTP